MRVKVSAFVDQVANNVDVAEVRSSHQRRDTVAVGVIHVFSQIDQKLHHFQPFGGRLLPVIAVDKRQTAGSRQGGLAVLGLDTVVRTMSEQQLDQLEIA